MQLEFDPDKDAANIVKHGISLSRALELDVFVRVYDRYSEPRMRAYGLIDERPHCLAYVERGRVTRAISLRRCRDSEFERYVR